MQQPWLPKHTMRCEPSSSRRPSSRKTAHSPTSLRHRGLPSTSTLMTAATGHTQLLPPLPPPPPPLLHHRQHQHQRHHLHRWHHQCCRQVWYTAQQRWSLRHWWQHQTRQPDLGATVAVPVAEACQAQAQLLQQQHQHQSHLMQQHHQLSPSMANSTALLSPGDRTYCCLLLLSLPTLRFACSHCHFL